MFRRIIIFCLFVFSFSAVAQSAEKWTEVGEEVPGFSILDLQEYDDEVFHVLDGDKEVELNSVIRKVDKPLAVVQVVEVGSSEDAVVCGSCISKGNAIATAIKEDSEIADRTMFLMVISLIYYEGAEELHELEAIARLKKHVLDARKRALPNVKIVADIDSHFQNAFLEIERERQRKEAASKDGDVNKKIPDFPVTLVLEAGYRGKVLNMHKKRPGEVVRTLAKLDALSKD